MANIITGSRILCSILMLFSPVFSVGFYVLYLLCGLTDMIMELLQGKQILPASLEQDWILLLTSYL